MAFEKSVTVTRSLGFTVVRTIGAWTTIFPCLLIAKAIEKVKENARTVVCALVALAAVVGIFVVSHSYQMKVWKEEAKKDQVGFCSADWKIARLQAREARGNPCFYVSILGVRSTLKWHRDQVLVLKEVMGHWDRWDAFDVTPDGVASWACQRDIPNR
jgi:hypothetical protein